jgi:hypothetical protein
MKPAPVPGEHITVEEDYPDSWVCVCGNSPSDSGFYPCDETGRPVEPTPGRWRTDWYICAACYRVIDLHTLAVMGVWEGANDASFEWP